MAYFMYFMQPHPYIIPIRVSVVQMDLFHQFMCDTLLPEENFEALYCIFRLLDANAFSIIPFETIVIFCPLIILTHSIIFSLTLFCNADLISTRLIQSFQKKLKMLGIFHP